MADDWLVAELAVAEKYRSTISAEVYHIWSDGMRRLQQCGLGEDTSCSSPKNLAAENDVSDAASSAREMRAVGATEAGSSEETLPGGSVSKTDV
ncbi:hypothetical protein Pr1d_32570 [Bythopirellula goksoeyrii]|uniref:Uncharacterized protein n=2 Tax=Bythopirellula goksoeyrii TaxID=1400387 RepID=A0A5B9QDS8_9BACT|nr:hypothetical protein Pr1d_32570 [Bythopirellula goksoeyrii]